MPVCPACQTPHETGQHYCKQCGHDLQTAPPTEKHCPQCGTAVTADQKFCHNCDAPLDVEVPAPIKAASRKWLLGALAAIGVVALVLVVTLSRKPESPPAPVTPVAPAPAVVPPSASSPAPPGSAETGLAPQLEKVLNNLKEANLKKDLILYMSSLSFVYPQLDKKRQEVLKTWEKFDFKKMAVTLAKVRDLGGDEAVAEVNWNTVTQNLATKELVADDFVYQVWFVKELGQWKVRKIEEMER